MIEDYCVKHCEDGVYRVYSKTDDLICECRSYTNAVYQCARAKELQTQQEIASAFNDLNTVLNRLISLEGCQKGSKNQNIFDSIHFMKSELEKYNSCSNT